MNSDPKFASQFSVTYSLRAIPGDTRATLTARVTEVAAAFRQEFVTSQSAITVVDELRRSGQFVVYGNDQAELERLPQTYKGFHRHLVLRNEDVQIIDNP